MKVRCPGCDTRYQVDADALLGSDGRAHCYRCGTVFHAVTEHVDQTAHTDATRRSALTWLKQVDEADSERELPFEVPDDRAGVAAVTLVLSGLSAAVGVNMVFLYPYTLLAKGWGREHRELSRVDLLLGMFVPYTIAVSLVVIATANTLHLDPAYEGMKLSPVEAAQVLAQGVGPLAPEATNATNAGRTQNRRVEIVVR